MSQGWMLSKSKELHASEVNEIWKSLLTVKHLCRKESYWVQISQKMTTHLKNCPWVQGSSAKKFRTRFWKVKQIETNFMSCCRLLALKKPIIPFYTMKIIRNSFCLIKKRSRKWKRAKACDRSWSQEDQVGFRQVETRPIGWKETEVKLIAYKDLKTGMIRVLANKRSLLWWKMHPKVSSVRKEEVRHQLKLWWWRSK